MNAKIFVSTMKKKHYKIAYFENSTGTRLMISFVPKQIIPLFYIKNTPVVSREDISKYYKNNHFLGKV